MIKIAIMIQAHKGFKQIKALVDSLVCNNIYLFIHIDKKNDKLYRQLLQHYKNSSNVILIENRVKVNWSGLSQVKATLNIMKTVYNYKINFDRVIFISGEDIFLKTKEYLIEFFYNNRDKEYLDFSDIKNYAWRLKQYNFFTECRYNRSFIIRALQKILRVFQNTFFINRTNLDNTILYKGSQWFNITGSALKYIIEKEQDIDKFKFTACSDEHFFQIMLLNSKFKNSIINNNLRYIIWEDNKSSPKYLSKEELEEARKSENIFARKVSENISLKFIQG